MKDSESLRKLLHSMNTFSAAYHDLRDKIGAYEFMNDTSVNNLKGFTETYPFDKSFDELPVDNWVRTVVEGVRKSAFKVLNYEYMNTGGNTMVGIFTVWLPSRNQTMYVLVNEEGCNLATVDYISNELDIGEYDDAVVETVDWDHLKGREDFFELYRYCLNEYTKSDCRHFGNHYAWPYHLLSDALQKQVDSDYLSWCKENNQGCIPTDGYGIVWLPDYTPPLRDFEKLLKDIKDFKSWHDATAGNEELYPHDYVITLNDHTVRIPYGADEFSHIDALLKDVIEEW